MSAPPPGADAALAARERAVLAAAMGAMGGAPMRWLARRLRVERHAEAFPLPQRPGPVRARARAALAATGDLTDAFADLRPGALSVFGRAAGGLRPVLVHVTVEPAGAGSAVRVEAAALEGLVRQRTAEGAARALRRALEEPAG